MTRWTLSSRRKEDVDEPARSQTDGATQSAARGPNIEEKERRARAGTGVILAIGFAVYFGISVWRVHQAYENPIISTSFVEEPFPLPQVVFCGNCLVPNDPESCGIPFCSVGRESYHDGMDSDEAVEDCSSWMRTLPREEVNMFAGLPAESFFAGTTDEVADRVCDLVTPPKDRVFAENFHAIYSSLSIGVVFLNITWTGDLLQIHGKNTTGISLVAGIAAAGQPLHDLEMFTAAHEGDAQVQVPTAISRVKRTHLKGRPDTHHIEASTPVPVGLALRGLDEETLSALGLDILDREQWSQVRLVWMDVRPRSNTLRVEEERSSFTWLEFLGNTAGVCSALLFVYTTLMGNLALRPWGLVQRGVFKTAPYQRLRQQQFDSQDGMDIEQGKGTLARGPASTTNGTLVSTRGARHDDQQHIGPEARSVSSLVDVVPVLLARMQQMKEAIEVQDAASRRRQDALERVLNARYCRELDAALALELRAQDRPLSRSATRSTNPETDKP